MYIDILLLFVIILFGFFGFLRGFISQILSLLSVICIVLFAGPLAHWLKENSGGAWFQQSPLLVLWGLSALFIAVLFMMTHGVIILMRKESGLSRADRWMGFGLGCVKGFVIALLLSLGLHLIPEHTAGQFRDLKADEENSTFYQMSRPLMEWKSLATFRDLSEIKTGLKNSEGSVQRMIPKGPWDHKVTADSD